MSDNNSAAVPIVRFLDSFLQEKNIKWLLGIGSLLVLGSSLGLVAVHWQDYPPVWKYLVFIAYTAGIFVAGEVSYWRLGLRKTGGGLMALTVLLLPVTFLAIHWVRPEESFSLAYLAAHGGLAAVLAGNFAFSCYAARRIFNHFLRGPQPTFLASYLILAAAGAVVPALPVSWGPMIGLALWAVLTAGVVKVNRRVFWLVEEERWPRIGGFFPIGLLSAQFIALAALNLAPCFPDYVSLDWLGFATVLTAIPMLLTADAVVRVIEQRTGGLLRPLPWDVVAPLGAGLLLTIAGVCLAATGLPRPYALSPAALLAAGLLGVAAHRLQKTSLAWATLVAIVVAYNFSPVFFQSLAASVVRSGAMAVAESRLPYPFYGLTYLPLMIGMSVASVLAARRGELFAGPLRSAALLLSMVALAASWGHPKALFPVGAVMVGVLALQAALFRERRLVTIAVTAAVFAALGWTAFARDVLAISVSNETPFLAMAAVGGLLLLPGRWLDRISPEIAANADNDAMIRLVGTRPRICQFASMLVATTTTIVLLAVSMKQALMVVDGPIVDLGDTPPSWPLMSIATLCGLTLIHAFIWLIPMLGEIALAAPVAFGFAWAIAHRWPDADMAFAATMVGLGYWLIGYLDSIAPRLRVSRALAGAAYRLSVVGLPLLAIGYGGPLLIDAAAFGVEQFPWLTILALTAWCFDGARRSGNRLLTVIGCAGVMGLASAGVAANIGVAEGVAWYPLAWSALACISLQWFARHRRTLSSLQEDIDGTLTLQRTVERRLTLIEPVYWFAMIVLYGTALESLLSLGAAGRLAGAAALLGLWSVARIERSQLEWRFWVVLANWQLLPLVAQSFASDKTWVWELLPGDLAPMALPIACLAALSRLACEHPKMAGPGPGQEVVNSHGVGMQVVAMGALVVSLGAPPAGFGLAGILMAAIGFAALAASQLVAACRRGSEWRVWLAEGILAIAAAYLWLMGVIHFGHGWSMYVLLILGVIAWAAGQAVKRRPGLAVMAQPLCNTGMLLPAGTVLLAVARHLLAPAVAWQGANSLALLLAAAFYFWQGVERGDKRFTIAAGTIVNLALCLLWRELAWSDPQLFMIPAGVSILLLARLLKDEIPPAYHNPLRYLGALVILVSPTFHIVGGSWLHMLTLMIASVAIVLVAIGMRVRALMYTGSAFLAADLVAMIVHGSAERPNVLWLSGIVLGAAVIGIAAYCENHRETLLQRLRLMAANISCWE